MLCLLLLAVSLRAMIPVGYMPDTAALRHGVVRISLCTSTGAVSVLQLVTGGQAHTGHDHDSDSNHMAGAECPFWASAHLAADLPSLALTPFLVAVRDEAVRFVAPAELPPLPPAGPPLGSRAPPLA